MELQNRMLAKVPFLLDLLVVLLLEIIVNRTNRLISVVSKIEAKNRLCRSARERS
jgi:hypothetical protein